MITRTVATYTYTVLAVNLVEGIAVKKQFQATKNLNSEKAVESYFYTIFDRNEYRFVRLEGLDRTATKYRMTIDDFIKNAEVVSDSTNKA